MFTLLMFVAVSMAAEYLQVEYGKGSMEVYEFGKCYCFSEDACYKYEKTSETKIKENVFSLNTNCESGVLDPNEYTLNEKVNDVTFKIITELPEHKFYYKESLKEDCTDLDNQVPCLMAEGNCERDYYSEDVIYRTYKLSEDKKKVEIQQYTDDKCTTKRKEQIHIGSTFDADTCASIDDAKVKFFSHPDQVLQIEYNKGVYEFYEFGKCFCFAGDGCYKYEKIDTTKVKEIYYQSATSCEGTPTTKEYTLGQKGDYDMTFTLVINMPEHQFVYSAFTDDDCSLEKQSVPCVMTSDNCERDITTQDNEAVYRTYRLIEEGEEPNKVKKIEIKQYTDNQCTTAKTDNNGQIVSTLDTNKCNQIEGKGPKGMFIPEKMIFEYFQMEYGKGSFEIYDFKVCYCFAGDGCYKYVKHESDSTKVNEYKYAENSNCQVADGAEEPTPTPLKLGQTGEIKYSVINKLPEHAFYYFQSGNNECSDEEKQPLVLLTSDNCELDYYSFIAEPSVELYNHYQIEEGENGAKKVVMKEYKDSACSVPSTKNGENDMASYQLEADKCNQIEGEGPFGKFFASKYELPSNDNGSIGTFILAIFLTVLFFF